MAGIVSFIIRRCKPKYFGRLLFFLLCIPAASAHLHAQQFLVEEFGSRQGLASAEIYTLFQDATGYLWMGTRLGVSKFDGREFTNFNGSETKRFGKVFSITEDGDGYIWIGAEHGLFYYYAGTVQHITLDITFPDPWIYAVAADKRSLWVGTANGPIFLDEKKLDAIRSGATLQYELFKNWSAFSNPDNQVFQICKNEDGSIYFGTRASVIQYDGKQYTTIWESKEPALEDVSGIGKGSNGQMYISCRTGYFYTLGNGRADTVETFTYSGGLDQWDEQQYYVLGVDKLYAFNGERPKLLYDLSKKGYDYLSSILVDREKNIWIGTWEGLVKLRKNVFTTWLPGVTENVNDLFAAEGGVAGPVMFGGNRGNVLIPTDTSGPGIWTITNPDKIQFQHYLPDGQKAFELSEVFGIYTTPTNTWFGSGYEGISVYHVEADGSGVLYRYGEKQLPDMHGEGFFHDQQHNLYCMAEGGLTQIFNEDDPAHLTFKYYPWPVDIGGQYLKIFDHAVLGDNEVYLATNFGLVYFDGDTLKDVDLGDQNLNDAIITSIAQDKDRSLWLATGNYGIYLVRPEKLHGNILTHIGQTNGLLSDAVLDLLIQRDQLWCAHYNGLTLLERTEKNWQVIKRIDESEGFLPYDFTYIRLAGNTSQIWLATTSGVQLFYPREIPFNRIDATPVITSVQLFNGDIPISDYASKDVAGRLAFHPVLPHNKNSVTFRFQSVSLTIPGQNACRYKLIGYDTAWTYANGFDEVTFAALAPGAYEFILQAANNDGAWSEITDRYTFTIRKPFWATWWFILSAILLTALASYAAYRYRLNQVIRINTIRNKIAGDLHDDIGSTLSSISMYSEIISTQLKDKAPESTPLLKKMSENSKEMIGNMSDIVWAIKPSNDSLKNIGDRMFNFATELCNAKGIEFSIHQGEDIAHIRIPMEQRRDLYLIFKEAVNNAVKYAGCKNLAIHFSKTGGRLHMQITDNGKGFNTAIHKAGNGLENMRRRAKAHGWDLDIKSEEDKGTTISLKI